MEDTEKNIDKNKKAPPEQAISLTDLKNEIYKQLKDDLQKAEKQTVISANFSDSELPQVKKRLYKMIDYTGKRYEWYTDQCHRLLQIGLALIAVGGVICSLFLKVSGVSIWTEVFAWLFGGAFFFTGLVIVYLYNYNIGLDHPYRKVVDIYSWFFAYRFPRKLSSRLRNDKTEAINQVKEVTDALKQFFTDWTSQAKTAQAFIREDIEQVAILMLLQRYRFQQAKLMATVLFVGILIAGLLLISLFVSFLVTDSSPMSRLTTSVNTPASTQLRQSPVSGEIDSPAKPEADTDDQLPADENVTDVSEKAVSSPKAIVIENEQETGALSIESNPETRAPQE